MNDANQLRVNQLPYTLKADSFSSHAQIVTLIRQRAVEKGRSPYVVLDIGCAFGFLRYGLPSPDFHLIGIEANAQAAQQAEQLYDEVYQTDITSGEWPVFHCQPQTIVFADILEHLAQPQQVLIEILASYAEENCQVIISLPNVAHLCVRLSLLVGRFDYTERGILDETHLRFFTLRTAKQLVEQGGVRLSSISVTPVPLHLISPLFSRGRILYSCHLVNYVCTRIFKRLLAYQFILEGYYHGN